MQLKKESRANFILSNVSDQDIFDLIDEGQLEKFCNILTLNFYNLENNSSKYTA